MAKELAAEGVHVALCSRDLKEVKTVSAELEKACGIRAVGVAADVASPADLIDFVSLAIRERRNDHGCGRHEMAVLLGLF